MNYLRSIIWNNQFLSNLSVIITIITPIWSIITIFLIRSYPRFQRWRLKKRALKNTKQSGIIIFTNSKDDDITNIVSNYIKKNKKLKKIENIKTVYLSNSPIIKKEDTSKIIDKLKKLSLELRNEGIVTKHIFIKSTVIVSAIIGSELANSGKVFLYHKDKNSSDYEPWGELAK